MDTRSLAEQMLDRSFTSDPPMSSEQKAEVKRQILAGWDKAYYYLRGQLAPPRGRIER